MAGAVPPDADRDGTRPGDGAGRAGDVLRVRAEAADIVVIGALLAAALWFYAAASSIEDIPGDPVGPAGFPRALSIALAVLCLAVVVGAGWRLAASPPAEHVRVEHPLRVVLGIVLVIAFPVAMARLGYYPAMGLWLLAFLWVGGTRGWIRTGLYAAGFLVFTKIVFEWVLKTPLP